MILCRASTTAEKKIIQRIISPAMLINKEKKIDGNCAFLIKKKSPGSKC